MTCALRILPITLLLLASCAWSQPRHLYLTWDNEDTAHTQTVVFQTTSKASEPRVEIYLDGPSGKATSLPVKTTMLTGTERRIHTVTLKNLSPATVYRFRAGDTRFGMSAWRSFRTMPSDGQPIRIATGGDMYRHPATVDLLKAAASHKPDIALVGGDIAYADGDLDRIGFWDDWLDNWEDFMNPKDGPMVGMICAIGNHEVDGAFDRAKKDAPFYFAFFPQGGEPYFVRRLSQDVEVVVLDTSHVTHHKAQVPFLEKALKSMQERDIPYRLALYHVPCYPSHRPYEDTYSRRGRQYWVPVFDRYGLTAGLENHDHTFKRTHPLKAGKIVADGTVYLGDGCWGRDPRAVAGKRWYQAKASSTYHVWMLSSGPGGLECQAVGRYGKVFDRTTLKGRAGGQ
jgi:hypothetical protein